MSDDLRKEMLLLALEKGTPQDAVALATAFMAFLARPSSIQAGKAAEGKTRKKMSPATRAKLRAIAAAARMAPKWTEERDLELVRMERSGMSLSEIGLAIGRSRETVAGRMKRIRDSGAFRRYVQQLKPAAE